MSTEFASEMHSALNRRIARGAAWMIGLRFADRTVGFLSTIVLARLLVPADFGLVALAIVMVASVGIFGEFGFELALIQNQKTERSHYDTAWTLSLLRGLLTAAMIACLAEPFAYFFDDRRLRTVILVLTLLPLLEGLNNIGTVAFQKDLTLNKEFSFRIVPRIIGTAIVMIFAVAWQNYWALIYGTVAGAALRLMMSYLMHSYRPRLSLAAWRELIGFSKWTLVANIANFANQSVSRLVVAKLLDAHSLGIFSMATQIADLATAEVIAPIKRVLLPGYAKLAHDTTLLRKAFLDVSGILALVALPVTIGIGLTAEFFVPILLGPKWDDTVPLIEILVISSGLRSISSQVQTVYLALGRPHLGAYASIGRALIYLPMLLFGLLQYGLIGAAIVLAIGQIVALLGSLYLMHRMIRVSLTDIFTACWRAAISSALMALSVCAVKWLLPVSTERVTGHLILLASTMLIGLVSYVCMVLLFWWFSGRPMNSAESYLLTYFGQALRKRRSATGEASSSVSS